MTAPIPQDIRSVLFFMRFGEPNHIKEFVENGTLYMNPVSYFRTLEHDSERGDKNENISGLHQSSDISLHINDKIVEGVTGQVTYYAPKLDFYQATHIFCISHITNYFEAWEDSKIFDDRIKKFGDSFVLIDNTGLFIERLCNKVKSLCDNKEIIKSYHGHVEYVDKKSYSGEMDVFTKTTEYAYQREYRIVLTSSSHTNEPFKMNIGSLKDICHVSKMSNFKNKVEIKDNNTKFLIS